MTSKQGNKGSNGTEVQTGDSTNCVSALSNHIRQSVSSAGSRMRDSLSNVSSPRRSRRLMNADFGKSLDPCEQFTAKRILQIWPDGEIPWILSEYQRSLVIRTWKDDFDSLYKLGADIYKVVFQKSPDAKMLFPQVAAAGDHWKDSRQFKSQALKFVQILSHIVKNLYHPEQMDTLLYTVGKAHRKYSNRGFRPAHWTVFQKGIEAAMTNQLNNFSELTEQEKVDAVETWKYISIYLVRKMKTGFQEDVTDR